MLAFFSVAFSGYWFYVSISYFLGASILIALCFSSWVGHRRALGDLNKLKKKQ